MRGRAVAPAALAALVLLLCGCSPSSPVASAPRPSTSAPAPVGPLGVPGGPGCAPTSPTGVDAASGLTEVQGTATAGNSLYGLIMTPQPLTASNSMAKFVWRMTGRGTLTVAVTRPNGSTGVLAWGPELHGGSTYHRPGEEWGTGIILNAPGCWRLDFELGTAVASVYLVVGP